MHNKTIRLGKTFFPICILNAFHPKIVSLSFSFIFRLLSLLSFSIQIATVSLSVYFLQDAAVFFLPSSDCYSVLSTHSQIAQFFFSPFFPLGAYSSFLLWLSSLRWLMIPFLHFSSHALSDCFSVLSFILFLSPCLVSLFHYQIIPVSYPFILQYNRSLFCVIASLPSIYSRINYMSLSLFFHYVIRLFLGSFRPPWNFRILFLS
jgi:hypothetical protein